MQLKILPIVTALVLSLWWGNVRCVNLNSKKLSVIPYGFQYDQEPFTGIVYSWEGDHLASLVFVLNGLRHGPDIQWYANGQRFIERHYDFGVESGQHKAWYENGNVRSLKSFENGMAHGEFFEWHSNGQASQFIVYDHGKEVAAKSWTAGGKPFYNYVWLNGSRIGLEGDRFCLPPQKKL